MPISRPPYLRRIADDELDLLFPDVAAIALEGPRAVGKTATATQRATTTIRLDDPLIRQVFAADPGQLTRGRPPVLVDEWQSLPESWDFVRRAVDDDRTGGRFLLTGSAAPISPPTHTGAGRIISLRMRPMTLAERGVGRPTVSLRALISGTHPVIEGATNVGAEQYATEIVASGFPGLRGLGERAVRAQLDGYLDRIIDRDFAELGSRELRNPAALRRWLQAYAAATALTASRETIRDAATPGEETKPNRVTVDAWRDTLERMWLLEPLPAWLPQRNLLARLGQSPKHHLADPALAARLRGASAATLLGGAPAELARKGDTTLFATLFESLVTLCVRVYAQAAEARVSHFRAHDGRREVDLIVERADQRVVAIEVKLARTVSDHDLRHLHWLQAHLGADLLDAVVITTGPVAYRRPDGIAVVPAALLGP